MHGHLLTWEAVIQTASLLVSFIPHFLRKGTCIYPCLCIYSCVLTCVVARLAKQAPASPCKTVLGREPAAITAHKCLIFLILDMWNSQPSSPSMDAQD